MMDYEPSTPGRLLPIHPDPWHIYTQAELEAYRIAAAHIWAVHHLMCMISICVENRNRQLERHAYPGQPSTRPEHVPPCCLCVYTLGPVLIDHPDGYDLVFTPHFEIVPECMHHGHLANTHLIERMWDDPYGYGLLRDPYDGDR